MSLPSTCIYLLGSYQMPSILCLLSRAQHYCTQPMRTNQSIGEKIELIFWKLSSIRMEISNDVACTLNWVQTQFNTIGIKFSSDSWIDTNSNTLIGIWSELPICRRLLCTRPGREIIFQAIKDNQVRETPSENAISSTKNIRQRTFVH
jgi:hypothetical protein